MESAEHVHTPDLLKALLRHFHQGIQPVNVRVMDNGKQLLLYCPAVSAARRRLSASVTSASTGTIPGSGAPTDPAPARRSPPPPRPGPPRVPCRRRLRSPKPIASFVLLSPAVRIVAQTRPGYKRGRGRTFPPTTFLSASAAAAKALLFGVFSQGRCFCAF